MLRLCGLLLLLDLVWTHGLDPGPSPGLDPGPGSVFVSRAQAQQVLVRRRRANSFMEEMRQGNMERECVEERCDKEEAREIFENEEKTNEFWTKYVDGDACESSPCLNTAKCKDTIGGFTCFCQEGFQGSRCEIVIPKLCENNNGGCDHFCDVERGVATCSCADGYFLEPDHTSCGSTEPFKCGAIFMENTRTIFIYDRNQTLDQDQTLDLSRTLFNQTLNMTSKQELNQSHLNLAEPTRTSLVQIQDSVGNATMSLSRSVQEQTPLGLAQDLDDDLGVDLGKELVQEKKFTSQRVMWTRIVNGEDCPPGECPWQALLLNEEHRGFCGGTILSDFIILTAAHCMNQSRHIYVILGEFDTQVKDGNEQVRQVEEVVIHHYYKPDTYHNDIALIKLATPIRFTRYIIPACLPTADFAEKVLMKESDGLVSGFGRLGEFSRPSTVLQRLAMPYVTRARCKESTNFRISQRMFCAGYEEGRRDACQGDSGGPHVTPYGGTHFITGIVSWGEGCARKGKFGVYTQVSKYINWIRDGMRVLVPSKPVQDQSKRKRRSKPQQDQGQDRSRTNRSGPEPGQTLRPQGFRVLYL